MKPHELIELCASVVAQQDVDPSFKNRIATHILQLKERVPDEFPALVSLRGEYTFAVAMNNVAVSERNLERARVARAETAISGLLSLRQETKDGTHWGSSAEAHTDLTKRWAEAWRRVEKVVDGSSS